jgi:hypothetical protein
MNRSLLVPAVCCAFGFVALLAILHQAAGREAATADARQTVRVARVTRDPELVASSYTRPAVPDLNRLQNSPLLSPQDAEAALTTLSGEYLRPWRKWETSPHRIYSRAMPRPIPSIAAEVALSPRTTEADSFLLATITIRTGKQSQAVPCVVDRISKQVRLFADGQWLSEDEWLKTAPLP